MGEESGRRRKEDEGDTGSLGLKTRQEDYAQNGKVDEALSTLHRVCTAPTLDCAAVEESLVCLTDIVVEGGLAPLHADLAVQQLDKVWFTILTHPPGIDASRVHSLANASIDLLTALAEGAKTEQTLRPIVNCLLYIVRSQLPTRALSQNPSACARALSALGDRDSWMACLKNKPAIRTLIAALEQQYEFSTQQSAASILIQLTCNCGDDLRQQYLDWGLPQALFKVITTSPPGGLPECTTGALGNCCNTSDEQFTQRMRSMLGRENLELALVPAVVQQMTLHSPCRDHHAWLLGVLIHNSFVSRDACTEAGAIQSAMAELAYQLDGNFHEAAQEDTMELINRLLDSCKGARALLGCNGVGVLVDASSTASCKALLMLAASLLSCVKNMRTTHAAVVQCLRVGAPWRLRQRCTTLNEQIGEDAEQLVSLKKTKRVVNDFVECIMSKMTPSLWDCSLHPISHRLDIWAVAFLMSDGRLEHLKSVLEVRDLLPPLCAGLGGGDGSEPPEVDRRAVQQAVAGSLLQLLHRLKSGLPPKQPAAVVQQATGMGSNGPAFMQAVQERMFKGESAWSQVKLVVEGRPFFVLRDALINASPHFRALLEGEGGEAPVTEVVIPNVCRAAWEAVMKYIYTGNADIPPVLATQVLRAASQYQVQGLKQLCLDAATAQVTLGNLPQMFALSKDAGTNELQQHCIVLALEHWAAGRSFAQLPTSESITIEPVGCSTPPLQEPEKAPAVPAKVTEIEPYGAGPPSGSDGGDNADANVQLSPVGSSKLEAIPIAVPIKPAAYGARPATPELSQKHTTLSSEVRLAPQSSSISSANSKQSTVVMTRDGSQSGAGVDAQLRAEVAAALQPWLQQMMAEILPTLPAPTSA